MGLETINICYNIETIIGSKCYRNPFVCDFIAEKVIFVMFCHIHELWHVKAALNRTVKVGGSMA